MSAGNRNSSAKKKRHELENINEWVENSAKRAQGLELDIFDLLKGVIGTEELLFFTISVDIISDIYYAPITNIPLKILAKVLEINPHKKEYDRKDIRTLVERIRDDFPIGNLSHESRLLSKAFRNFQKDKFTTHLMMISVNFDGANKKNNSADISNRKYRDGKVSKIEYIDEKKLQDGLFVSIGESLEIVDDGLLEETFARPLRMILNEYDQKEVSLFLSPDRRQDPEISDDSRQFQLVQVGFLIHSPNIKELRNEANAKRFIAFNEISRFASYNLLLEKERYFQKGLRQAVRGRILKYGDGNDIRDQIRILRELQKQKRFNVAKVIPPLDEDVPENNVLMEKGNNEDTKVTNSDMQFAWYQMPRFTMQCFFDLLTATEGLQKYEVKSIVRSCFAHLRNTYWGYNSIQEYPSIETDTYLSAALALALDASEKAISQIATYAAMILENRPIKFPRQIELFDKKLLEDTKLLIDVLTSGYNESLEIGISANGSQRGKRCLNPIQLLRKIGSAIKAEYELPHSSKIMISDSNKRLHGDAHFGNFLVNMSIPEDPIIISIDQRSIKLDRDRYVNLVKPYCSSGKIDTEISEITLDPIYDIAEFMLSSTCGYGLAYRHAFNLSVSRKTETGAFCQLIKQSDDEYRKQSEAGGISGSQIVKIDAPVCSDTWRYHEWAASASIDEFHKLCLEFIASKRKEFELYKIDIKLSLNASFVRLWLLTAFHAFSITEQLFPSDIRRALTMFLLAVRFVNKGATEIEKIVSERLIGENSLDRLRILFTKDLFED